MLQNFCVQQIKTVNLDPGLCGEIQRVPVPQVLDDCGGLVITQTEGPTGNDFIDIFNSPYTYSYEVVDADGNLATCSFEVAVAPYANPTETLNCNDHINITVNGECEIDFTADMLLEGGPYGCYDTYLVDSQIVSASVGTETYEVSITDPITGYSCWGYVTLEDKEEPTIDCGPCAAIGGSSAADYAPECILNCYEQPILQLRYDDGLRDDLVQEDYEDFVEDAMSDNCDNWNGEDVSFYDQYQSFGACVGTRLTRTWTVGFTRADGTRGTVSLYKRIFLQHL